MLFVQELHVDLNLLMRPITIGDAGCTLLKSPVSGQSSNKLKDDMPVDRRFPLSNDKNSCNKYVVDKKAVPVADQSTPNILDISFHLKFHYFVKLMNYVYHDYVTEGGVKPYYIQY